MALSFSNDSDVDGWLMKHIKDDMKLVHCTITLDTSYPTGGEAITAANFGLDSIHTVIPYPTDQSGTYIPVWDSANSKLKMMSALGTEVADLTDLSTVKVDVLVIGK